MRRSAAHGRSRARHLDGRHRCRAVAEVDDQRRPRPSAAGAAALPTIQRSTRRSRFGAVVPRVGSPSARARPAA